jgi:arylsulfatase A-like enzyme
VSQPRAIPPGWSEWYAGLKLAYFGHSMNRNGVLKRYGDDPASYQTDVYARTAVAAVRRRAAGAQPFFLWLSFFAPHVGGPREPDDPPGVTTPVPAPRHRDLFASQLLPPSLSFNEPDLSDKPAAIRRRPLLSPDDEAAIAEKYRQRLESLVAVDEAIASVVAALRASGELGNTLIVFTSDNGFLQGEHRIREGKELLYEPSIRVPLILRGPGVRRGLRHDEPVSNVDLAATVAEVAGAIPGRTLDGRSLIPLAADSTLHWGRDLLLERGPGESGVGLWRVTAIRTPRYEYAEHATGERELYDFDVDPEQLRSLHEDPALDAVEAELSGRLAALRACAGAACSKGPALGLVPVTVRDCATAMRVSGLDERLVIRVDFLAGQRVLGRDVQPPFEQPLKPVLRSAQLRALVTLADGRRLTLQTIPRPCA